MMNTIVISVWIICILAAAWVVFKIRKKARALHEAFESAEIVDIKIEGMKPASVSEQKIIGLTEEIRKVEAFMAVHQQFDKPEDKVHVKYLQACKQALLKELLAELALSGVSFKTNKSFIERLTSYLEKSDSASSVSKELKSNLAEVEKLMPV
ncbi:MAG: hypothetical protein AAB316_09450 [Bacteroidota bacterium]